MSHEADFNVVALPHIAETGLTPNEYFFKHTSDKLNVLDARTWQLNVTGLGESSLVLSLEDLQTLPYIDVGYTVASVRSTPRNLLIGHADWRGVPFRSVVELAALWQEAKYAQFRSANGYSTYLPLNMLDKAVLAYRMNGAVLPVEQGYPVRLIVPGVYDYKMPKWLHSIEFTASPASGQYESLGWSTVGKVQTTSAFFTPRVHEQVSGIVRFGGMAFAGLNEIIRIELSIDDGDWMPVPFKAAPFGSWTCWQIDWMPPAPGDFLVKVRATDNMGFTQPDNPKLAVYPNGSSAIHAVVFRVSA